MLEAVHEILVFKTSIASVEDFNQIAAVFDGNHRIKKWNVDLLDVDCVLRVEGESISIAEIEDIVSKAGFVCKELPD